MAEPDDHTDQGADALLPAIWDRLEQALELSASREVMSRLDELESLCQSVVDLVRTHRQGGGQRPS